MSFVRRTETDAQRVFRLADECAELSRSAVEKIPLDAKKLQLNYKQIFDHDVVGTLTNIAGYSRLVSKKSGNLNDRWHTIKALAKTLYLKLDRVFAVTYEENQGADLIGALMLVNCSRSFELEIEDGREQLVKEYGENSELVEEFDTLYEEIESQLEGATASLPQELQAMFRIRSKLDEIVQLALRNMSQEKEFDGLGL